MHVAILFFRKYTFFKWKRQWSIFPLNSSCVSHYEFPLFCFSRMKTQQNQTRPQPIKGIKVNGYLTYNGKVEREIMIQS